MMVSLVQATHLAGEAPNPNSNSLPRRIRIETIERPRTEILQYCRVSAATNFVGLVSVSCQDGWCSAYAKAGNKLIIPPKHGTCQIR